MDIRTYSAALTGVVRRSVVLCAGMSALSPLVALCFARAPPTARARKKRQGYAKEMTNVAYQQ